MYLKEIYLQNTGPISKCRVKPPFDTDKNPLPIVIVGPNGSGKSIFLSYIVDSLMEFAKQAFRDIVRSDGLDTPYFRVVHPRGIKSGEQFSLSLLHFNVNNDNLYYCEKSGLLDPTAYSSDVKSIFAPVWKWPTEGSHKDVSTDQEDNWSTDEIHELVSPSGKIIKAEMQKGAYAFFPASRHENPVWLNPRSLEVNMDASANRRFSSDLDKPLQVETCAERNIGWILDVLFDASVDSDIIRKLQKGVALDDAETINWNNSQALQLSRRNIEHILRKVIQDKHAKLHPKLRNDLEHRIAIRLGNGQVIPNLQSLSDGQSQLFHLFTTIMRYGERTDLNRSIHLSKVTGLVIIDEIAAYLHPTLQYSVVPKLIKLFPKVQFIVSSHSPLFLLGMEEEFGTDGLAILELPDGNKINSERFSEFGKAFEYYQATDYFENEVEKRFARGTKPLVLTEGPLDSRYAQAALTQLGHQELLNALDIEFVGVEDEKGETRHGGDRGLNQFRNTYEANSSLFHRPILLLYDCDTRKPNEQIEKLWVRSIPPNNKNTKVKKGIENLFSSDLFEERFYKTEVKEGDYGERNIITEFKKKEFCQWICENGKNAKDFANFVVIVDILKEFVEAYQSASDQPPV